MMVTVEFTMDEAYAAVDAVRELLERHQFGRGPIDREALRTAGHRMTNAVGSAEFYELAAELEQAA